MVDLPEDEWPTLSGNCPAMKGKTYKGNEGAFEKDWKVISVPQESPERSCGRMSCKGAL